MGLARRAAYLVGATVLALGLGCGVRKGAPEWIGGNAAVVRCTVAGPTLELPRLFGELPSPPLPTGLYARSMDPLALDQLGFERDRVVCASLQAPDAAELEAAGAALVRFDAQRRELGKAARKLGACHCAYADALDARALVPGCVGKPTKHGCELDPDALEALREQLEPLRARLASTEIPRTHWRLFGRSDRPGRFLARSEQLLPRHAGGSEIFVPRSALPPQPGTALIAELLALEHVVAVVRQDGGRALLVIREIDGVLIFDHFAYADWSAGGSRRVEPELYALLGHLDDAQLARTRAALAPPSQAREPLFAPRKGYLLELDHAALERVDRATLIAAEFAGLSYDEALEHRELPTLMTDRVALQVPYGTHGEVLRARLRLSEEGRAWLGEVRGQRPVEAAASLAGAELVPEFEAADPTIAARFVLRGQPTEQLVFAGLTALPKLLLALASADVGARFKGTIDDFHVTLPSGPFPGELPSRAGVEELRERLSLRSHSLSVELRDGGRILELELE